MAEDEKERLEWLQKVIREGEGLTKGGVIEFIGKDAYNVHGLEAYIDSWPTLGNVLKRMPEEKVREYVKSGMLQIVELDKTWNIYDIPPVYVTPLSFEKTMKDFEENLPPQPPPEPDPLWDMNVISEKDWLRNIMLPEYNIGSPLREIAALEVGSAESLLGASWEEMEKFVLQWGIKLTVAEPGKFRPGSSARYNRQENEITINRDWLSYEKKIARNIMHEIGHAMYYALTPEEKEDWTGTKKRVGGVSFWEQMGNELVMAGGGGIEPKPITEELAAEEYFADIFSTQMLGTEIDPKGNPVSNTVAFAMDKALSSIETGPLSPIEAMETFDLSSEELFGLIEAGTISTKVWNVIWTPWASMESRTYKDIRLNAEDIAEYVKQQASLAVESGGVGMTTMGGIKGTGLDQLAPATEADLIAESAERKQRRTKGRGPTIEERVAAQQEASNLAARLADYGFQTEMAKETYKTAEELLTEYGVYGLTLDLIDTAVDEGKVQAKKEGGIQYFNFYDVLNNIQILDSTPPPEVVDAQFESEQPTDLVEPVFGAGQRLTTREAIDFLYGAAATAEEQRANQAQFEKLRSGNRYTGAEGADLSLGRLSSTTEGGSNVYFMDELALVSGAMETMPALAETLSGTKWREEHLIVSGDWEVITGEGGPLYDPNKQRGQAYQITPEMTEAYVSWHYERETGKGGVVGASQFEEYVKSQYGLSDSEYNAFARGNRDQYYGGRNQYDTANLDTLVQEWRSGEKVGQTRSEWMETHGVSATAWAELTAAPESYTEYQMVTDETGFQTAELVERTTEAGLFYDPERPKGETWTITKEMTADYWTQFYEEERGKDTFTSEAIKDVIAPLAKHWDVSPESALSKLVNPKTDKGEIQSIEKVGRGEYRFTDMELFEALYGAPDDLLDWLRTTGDETMQRLFGEEEAEPTGALQDIPGPGFIGEAAGEMAEMVITGVMGGVPTIIGLKNASEIARETGTTTAEVNTMFDSGQLKGKKIGESWYSTEGDWQDVGFDVGKGETFTDFMEQVPTVKVTGEPSTTVPEGGYPGVKEALVGMFGEKELYPSSEVAKAMSSVFGISVSTTTVTTMGKSGDFGEGTKVNNRYMWSFEGLMTGLAGEDTTDIEAPSTDLVVPKQDVTIVSVIDGDTVVLSTGEEVRLLGFDAPELGSPGYTEAKEIALKIIQDKGEIVEGGINVRINWTNQRDFIGRRLGEVIFTDGSNLSQEVVADPEYAKLPTGDIFDPAGALFWNWTAALREGNWEGASAIRTQIEGMGLSDEDYHTRGFYSPSEGKEAPGDMAYDWQDVPVATEKQQLKSLDQHEEAKIVKHYVEQYRGSYNMETPGDIDAANEAIDILKSYDLDPEEVIGRVTEVDKRWTDESAGNIIFPFGTIVDVFTGELFDDETISDEYYARDVPQDTAWEDPKSGTGEGLDIKPGTGPGAISYDRWLLTWTTGNPDERKRIEKAWQENNIGDPTQRMTDQQLIFALNALDDAKDKDAWKGAEAVKQEGQTRDALKDQYGFYEPVDRAWPFFVSEEGADEFWERLTDQDATTIIDWSGEVVETAEDLVPWISGATGFTMVAFVAERMGIPVSKIPTSVAGVITGVTRSTINRVKNRITGKYSLSEMEQLEKLAHTSGYENVEAMTDDYSRWKHGEDVEGLSAKAQSRLFDEALDETRSQAATIANKLDNDIALTQLEFDFIDKENLIPTRVGDVGLVQEITGSRPSELLDRAKAGNIVDPQTGAVTKYTDEFESVVEDIPTARYADLGGDFDRFVDITDTGLTETTISKGQYLSAVDEAVVAGVDPPSPSQWYAEYRAIPGTVEETAGTAKYWDDLTAFKTQPFEIATTPPATTIIDVAEEVGDVTNWQAMTREEFRGQSLAGKFRGEAGVMAGVDEHMAQLAQAYDNIPGDSLSLQAVIDTMHFQGASPDDIEFARKFGSYEKIKQALITGPYKPQQYADEAANVLLEAGYKSVDELGSIQDIGTILTKEGSPGLWTALRKMKSLDEFGSFMKALGKGVFTAAVLVPDISDAATVPIEAATQMAKDWTAAMDFAEGTGWQVAPSGWVIVDKKDVDPDWMTTIGSAWVPDTSGAAMAVIPQQYATKAELESYYKRAEVGLQSEEVKQSLVDMRASAMGVNIPGQLDPWYADETGKIIFDPGFLDTGWDEEVAAGRITPRPVGQDFELPQVPITPPGTGLIAPPRLEPVIPEAEAKPPITPVLAPDETADWKKSDWIRDLLGDLLAEQAEISYQTATGAPGASQLPDLAPLIQETRQDLAAQFALEAGAVTPDLTFTQQPGIGPAISPTEEIDIGPVTFVEPMPTGSQERVEGKVIHRPGTDTRLLGDEPRAWEGVAITPETEYAVPIAPDITFRPPSPVAQPIPIAPTPLKPVELVVSPLAQPVRPDAFDIPAIDSLLEGIADGTIAVQPVLPVMTYPYPYPMPVTPKQPTGYPLTSLGRYQKRR